MSEPTNNILVAVPYYGTLSLPPLGLSRVFFVVAADTGSGKVVGIELQVWDPKNEPNLSVWMRTLGISGVICSDSGSHYRAALDAEKIWLVGNQDGEAADLVERWAAGALEQSTARRLGKQLESWCRPQWQPALAI